MSKKIKDKKRNKTEDFKKNISRHQLVFFGFIIVLLPLINYNEVFDRALMPQLLALSVFLLVAVLTGFFISKNYTFELSVVKNPLVYLMAAYLIITILSSFFAVNFKESLFEIIKTLLVFLALIIGLNIIIQNGFRISILSDCFLVSGIIFLLIGYYQYFTLVLPSPDKLLPDGLAVIYAVEGTMEHKNLYSSALFMFLPFLAWGFWKNKGKKRILFGAVISLTLVMILLLSTRAVWVGFLFAGFVMVLVLITKIKQFNLPRRLRMYSIIAILLVGVSGVVFLANKQSTSNFSVGDRFRSIFDPEASNNQFRLNVWKASLDIWQDNPVLGVGAGNWKLAVPPYLKNFDFSINEINWTRPHNDFLWVLTEKGLVGLIIYLALFLVSFTHLFYVINRSENKDYKVLALLMTGGLAGYLVISFFDFPSERIFHQTIIAIWLALIVFMRLSNHSEKPIKNRNQLKIAGTVAALLFFCVVYSYSAINFEIAVKKTQESMAKRNWPQMFANAQKIPTTFRNVDNYITPVHHYFGFAKQNLKEYAEAKEFYLQALEEHPTKVSVMNNLGLIYYLSGDPGQAKKYYEMALDILPTYTQALINISQVCHSQGNYRESLDYLRQIPKNNWDNRLYNREKQLLDLINASN